MSHERAKLGSMAGLLAVSLLGGCTETDAWLLDPSVMGRWEKTPTSVPILSRLVTIEGPEDEWVQHSDPTPADLLPELTEYRLGPGDRLSVAVWDIPDEGRVVSYERFVDTRGFIDLPNVGPVPVAGKSVSEAEEAVKTAMKPLVTNPLAGVEILSPHQNRVSIFGAVQNPNQYLIPTADYKLLDALTSAGGFAESSREIYIIRQVPLSEASAGKPKGTGTPAGEKPPAAPSGEQLNQLIDDLSKPKTPPEKPAEPKPEAPKPSGSPSVMQPQQPAAKPPMIDLIDPKNPAQAPAPEKPKAPDTLQDSGEGTWVYLNGRWVKVRKPEAAPGAAQPPEAVMSQPTTSLPLVTQRVIRVPSARLASGDARVNIVIRPGDVIRVPPGPAGNVYITGQVSRPGVYQMADELTMLRALTAAGGPNATAMTEKVDLTRMVGSHRQAIIRLDVRAMAEGTQPDIYLKSNDMINVGTSFWATPMAVIRNGIRASYGYGFIIDRNFGNDVFGAPPVNQFGG